ncbi:tyrosine-type recombinase/integrase [Geomonas azotofigens]|uniref:tyrosine-type recombinase/integrase n=1 Tax=Geomonas azotofigens TaxID=2843196 RepID=UPI001C11C363|nr:integrase arm-type DNA-binding domain-containing protein [Geomonas azotofigens]MBU5613920.1 integrase arm-type DNA-binding domain-containing protein [Geomonas azotofigens]
MPKRIPQLSVLKIDNAKARDKAYKLADGYGLYLLVTPSGGKLWQMQYRFDGKQKVLSFRAYPAVSLKAAREKRDEAKKLLAVGLDPGQVKKEKKKKKLEAYTNTFEAVAREWFERFKSKWTPTHGARKLAGLEKDVFPSLGQRPIGEIKPPELLKVLCQIETRSLEIMHKAKCTCGQVFRYAVSTGRAERNPVPELRDALPPVKNGHFAAPTDPKKVAPLMRTIYGYQGSFVVKCALKLAPLFFIRPGELRKAEWTEIDFVEEQWNVPAEKMKMKVAHTVPLSRQAIAILHELHTLTGHGKYVFAGRRSSLNCMSDNAVNAALRSMGYTKDDIVGHGFRAMARTILAEVLLFRVDIIEHQLAHAVKDPNGVAYNRTTFLPQRRHMMQVWADYLDALKKCTTQDEISSVNKKYSTIALNAYSTMMMEA